MAIPVIATQSPNAESGSPTTALTVNKPSGVVSGDLLIIMVVNDENSSTPQFDDVTNKPTGFTAVGVGGSGNSDCHYGIYWRIADGTEGSSFSCPCATSNDMAGICFRITGHDQTSPIDVVGANTQSGAASNVDITEVTTTKDNCLVLAMTAYDGGDGDPFTITGTGWTGDSFDGGDGTGAGVTLGWAQKDQATAGLTGSVEFRQDTQADGYEGRMFAIVEDQSGASIVPQAMYHYQHNTGLN